MRSASWRRKTASGSLFLSCLPWRTGDFSTAARWVATSIAPYNAALIMELARDWLKPHAQVLDPFCGVGTMLVERARLMPADPLYGVDIYEEAIQKARENAELAGLPIHYINRDIRDFTHEYLFDEVISDMPGTGKTRDKGQILELYESFLNRIPVLLKKNGVLVLYNGGTGISSNGVWKRIPGCFRRRKWS